MFISVYVGVCLLVFAIQSKLVYFPKKGLNDTPASAKLAYENDYIETDDGVTIHGWWVPCDNAIATVMCCHGNAGNIAGRIDTILLFHKLGLNVFMFDYRGYGRSEGSPTEEGTYLDADAVWKHLTETRNVPPEKLIIFGRSLGGSVAAHLAWKRPAPAVILESTFTSVPDLGADVYPFLPVRLLCRIKYDSKAIIADIDCPMLIIHSPEDDIVPFKHSQVLRDARGRDRCEFLEIRGGHNWGWSESGKRYTDGLRQFIRRNLRDRRSSDD